MSRIAVLGAVGLFCAAVAGACDGALLESVPLILDFADVSGKTKGDAFSRTDASYHSIDLDCPCAQGSREPLADLFMRFDIGGWTEDFGLTDQYGDYGLEYPGTPGYVKTELNGTKEESAGKYVRTESALGAPTASSGLVSGPTAGVNVTFSSQYAPGTSGYEFDLAHVTAFYWITKSSRIAAAAVSPSVLDDLGLDQRFTCAVNVATMHGGGDYDPSQDRIRLGRSGLYGGPLVCAPSPAPTLIVHEHGHRLRYKAYQALGSPNPQWDLKEGSADAWAAIVTGTNCLGRGFQSRYDPGLACPCPELDTFCFRDADNTLRYPSNDDDFYAAGLVLAGAYWDAYLLMQAAQVPDYQFRLQKLFINALFLTPPAVDRGIVTDLLLLDDAPGVWGGDGNILNGTPHYDYIARGFGKHNLDAPGFFSVSYPNGRPANVEGGQEELTVRLGLWTSGLVPEDVDRVRLYYRSGSSGSFSSVDLARPGPVPEGWPDDWVGVFPDPGGDIVEYYVTVKAVGQEYEMPDPAEAAPYNDEGDTVCEAVYVTYSRPGPISTWYDDFETDRGWTPYPFLNNPWERVVPIPYQLGTSPPSDYDGSGRCYVTGNGSGEYVPSGNWYLISPVIEIDDGAGADADAVVRFASWYSNGYTYWTQPLPYSADVFEVEVRNAQSALWIKLDGSPRTEPDLRVGPFEIESMTGWYEKYFRLGDVFAPPFPDEIQVRFKASGFDPMGAVEAGIDWFEVAIFDS